MNRAAAAQILFILIAAAAVYLFVHTARNDHQRASCMPMCHLSPTYAGYQLTAPDFELPDMSGAPVRLSDYRGKTVIMNFWTKTCEPCLEEMPHLAELAKLGNERGDFVVITVSTDAGPDAVRDTLAVAVGDDEIPFKVLFDPESEIVLDKYGTRLFPETWFIDKEGVIRARFDGYRDWTSPLVLELAEATSQPLFDCRVQFKHGKPTGPLAGMCGGAD